MISWPWPRLKGLLFYYVTYKDVKREREKMSLIVMLITYLQWINETFYLYRVTLYRLTVKLSLKVNRNQFCANTHISCGETVKQKKFSSKKTSSDKVVPLQRHQSYDLQLQALIHDDKEDWSSFLSLSLSGEKSIFLRFSSLSWLREKISRLHESTSLMAMKFNWY